MRDQPCVSVIMPVYKAEKTLYKAAQSILNQSLKDIELILIDDNSPDNSPRIADELSGIDARVQVVHKERNEGPGFARNAGISCANGEYICFVDSDDWIEADMLHALYEKAREEDSDVVVCGYFQEMTDANGQVQHAVTVTPPDTASTEQAEAARLTIQLDMGKLFSFLWNKLYRTATILNSGISFPAKMFNEDFLFNIALFEHVNRISTVDKPLYHYIRPVSTTLSTTFIAEFEDVINQRFELSRRFAQRANVYDGQTRAEICSIHIKHLFAVFERHCWKQSGMTPQQRRVEVRRILAHPHTQEAIRYATGATRAARIMNGVIRTRSPLWITSFAQMIRLTKKRMPRIFNTIK